jgi:hypothetical protein
VRRATPGLGDETAGGGEKGGLLVQKSRASQAGVVHPNPALSVPPPNSTPGDHDELLVSENRPYDIGAAQIARQASRVSA